MIRIGMGTVALDIRKKPAPGTKVGDVGRRSGATRFFVVTVLGYLAVAAMMWMLLRPPPPDLSTREDQKVQQSAYSPGSPRCFPSRLNRLPAAEAPDERYRCEQAQEEHRLRSDDLVQQTRAADAAYAVADLTYRQTLIALAGMLVGLLTLVAAFYAAWYARRAAEETGRGAEATEDTLTHSRTASNAELRPWVTVDCSVKSFRADDERIACEYEILFSNLGKTAASEFYIATKTIVTGREPGPLAERYFTTQLPPKAPSKAVLLPNRSHSTRVASVEPRDTVGWEGGAAHRHVRIVCLATAFYRSPFDEQWHRTDSSFVIGAQPAGLDALPFIREDMTALDVASVVVARFGAGENS